MNVNQVTFCTAIILAVGTGGAAFAAATTANTVATVAYSILAVGLAGVSVASITAWVDTKSDDVSGYFGKFKDHAAFALVGAFQLFAQVLVQAVVQGLSTGISNNISRRIGGADRTVQFS